MLRLFSLLAFKRLFVVKFVYLCLIFIVFLFSSCASKKKVSHGTKDNVRETSTSKTTVKRGKSNLTEYYSDVLGVSPSKLNPTLYAVIDQWMDVPHRLGGMDMKGIDCSGFVTTVYEDVYGQKLPRISRDMANQVKRKYENDLKEGDLVFFSFGGKGVDHVGIYLHNGKFVHVSTKSGVVISNLKDGWYYKYFTRCGTPKN